MLILTLWLAISTFALAVFGIFQTLATRSAAKAAEVNAKVLLESQRPQIAALAYGDPVKTLADRDSPRVQIALSNRGLTPAYDLTYESWIELLPLPFKDFTPSADNFRSTDKTVVYANHEPLVLNIPFRNGLTEQQRAEIRTLQVYVCIRIRADYRDAFTTKRYANFGFYVLYGGLGFLPKYNDAN